MADNVTADPGAGGAVFATDDDGTAHHPYVKVEWGADNTQTKVAAGAAALPIQDGGNSLTVDGTVGVSGTVTVDGSGVTQPVSHAALTELAAAINASSQMDVNIAAQAGALTVASHAVTNAGTFAVQVDGAALTALQLIDDSVFTDDAPYTPATSKLLVIGAQADETAADSVDEGDAGALRMSLARGLHVNVRDDAGDSCMDGTNNAVRVNVVAGAAAGGTSATDDAPFTAAAGSGTPMMGFVTADSVDSGDVGVVGMLANRQLKVTLYDSAGGELAVGGGTQYTEDAVATADPIGNALILVREDARAGSLTSADGDNVAARGTNAGELYVKHVDSVAVTNAGLTELAAAINASSQLDVNIAASNATITVASHAVTNAGTFATQVDGAALTALQLIDDPVLVDDAAFTPATSKVMMVGAQCDATAPDSVDEGDAGALRMTADRSLHISIRDTAGNNRGANGNASNQLSVSVDNTVTVASHAVTNAGTFATQVDGAALTSLQLIDNASIADDAAFTPATTGVTMAGFFADETAPDSVDEGDGGAARMTLDRRQIVVNQGHANGGLNIFRSIDIDETEEEIKATAGCVYGMWITNTATTTRWVKFYNATAANTTVGTTTPVITIGIPGNTTDDIAGSFGPGGVGIQFGTAITVAATTGVADNDTGAPGANDVIINVFYS